MSDKLYDDIDISMTTLERFDDLERRRQTFEVEAKEVMKYVFPRRSIWEDTNGEFRRVGETLYDGTAVQANAILANGLMGHLVTEGNPWFKLGLPWIEAMDLPGVGQWLDIVERVLYDDFHRSNWYEQCQEAFLDLGALGNACIYSEEGADGAAWYLTIHPFEVFFDVNERDEIDTVYRRFHLTVRQLIQKFGWGSVHEKVVNAARDKNLGQRIEVVHACEPRTLIQPDNPSAKNKKWKSAYWDRTNEHLMNESGYDRFPFNAVRWATNSGETYGRGPGSDAFVAIWRANLIGKDVLTASQKALFPPANVPESMRNRFSDNPKARNYFRDPDQRAEYMDTKMVYPIALDREKDVREIIKEAFMVDMFLMLNSMDRQKSRTATEVLEMQSEKAAILGTAVGRVASELLDPTIDLAFYRARKAGRIPPPPIALLQWMAMNNAGAGHLKVEYIGPLAQALKRFHVTQGITQGLNAVLPYAAVWPDIPDNFDKDQIARIVSEAYGMPARVIIDPKKVQAMRQAKMQAAQQAAQMQQQMAGADAYQKMVKAPEAGSPLEAAVEKAKG